MQPKPEKKSPAWLEGYKIPPGYDSLLEKMKRESIPLTRENYLKLAGLEEPLDAELEWEIPPMFSRIEGREQ